MTLVNEIDLRILHELQIDGRLSNQDLADRVGLSPSACLRRVRQLENAGAIEGYRAIVSQTAVGLPITAFVRLTIGAHDAATVGVVEEQIRAIPEVTEAHLLAGDFDYQLKVAVASFEAYERLLRESLRKITSVTAIQTTFAFGVTKNVAPLCID